MKQEIMQSKSRYTILIVDDIHINIKILTYLLRDEGYGTISAKSGEEALTILENKKVDLIILDVMMPSMDGFEVCRQLKIQPETAPIPIIFVTAKNQTEHIIKGLKAGAQDYVTKPFNNAELLARVNTHIELKVSRKRLEINNKVLEKAIEQRTKELELANRQLLRLDRSKTNFINIINHELRTPLNGIAGFSSLLEKELTTKRQQKLMQLLKDSVNRLATFMEASLLITKLDIEKYPIKKDVFSIKELLNKLLDILNTPIQTKNIEVVIDWNTIDELKVNADRQLFEIALRHILTNAVNFTGYESKIWVKAEITQEKNTISICDSGEGFSEEVLDGLFLLFSTGNVDYYSKGFGLGLATVKLIMDIHSGEIKLQNRDEGGACVKLIFNN